MTTLKIQSLFNVEGRVAVVTGGGAGGLGALMAEGLVANGVKVYICGRREQTLKAQIEKLNAIAPGKSRYIVADISKKDDIENLVKFVEKEDNTLDILIHNAAVTYFEKPANHRDSLETIQAAFKASDPENWRTMITANTWAPYMLTASFLHLLGRAASKGEGRGSVIIIGSGGTQTWNSFLPFEGYISTRAAQEHVAVLMASKLRQHKIRVNILSVGSFKSDTYPPLPGSVIPLQRAGSAEDLAGTIIYLSSAAGSYITAQRVSVDGGLHLIVNGPESFVPVAEVRTKNEIDNTG
ncbi:NAD(P)-binding protein [Dentipellis sp. KUC8613]|nr:NAD(P)-binding protein [Dentipellis sp. KUC8613]